MTQTNSTFKHAVLARLDATIERLESTTNALTDALSDADMRKSKSLLLQTHEEILNIRAEAVATLTRLNTFGATLEIMGHPEAGVDMALSDVLKWFLLLTECERAFISLYDAEEEEFILKIDQDWLDVELRPVELTISEKVMSEVRQSKDIFSSSNADLATDSYQKSGSWRFPIRTVIGIPLIWEDDLIGIFYGDKKITSGVMPRDMLPLFKLYAAQATIAIRNAQLFAKLSGSGTVQSTIS